MSTTTAPRLWRRTRPIALFVTGLLAVVVLLAVAAGTTGASTTGLDPTNPKPNGARALAKVLDHHGVDVHVAEGQAAFLRARVGTDTTVVVTSARELSTQTTRTMLRHAAAAGTLVLAGPTPDEIPALRVPVSSVPVESASRAPASCASPLLDGLRLTSSAGDGYVRPARAGGTGCFPGGELGGPLTANRIFRSLGAGSETYLLGTPEILTNNKITDADNAAIALRLLGQHPRLVWYVADYADVPIGDTGSLKAQLPRWLAPGLWLVVVTMLALMYWRGRRLGRVVSEPLPVVVKGIESTLARGRLYRKAHDREHAAAVLRAATRTRIAGLLRLPADLGPESLVDAVSRRTTREPAAVSAALVDGPISTDDQLTDLAQRLAALEKEVRQP